MKTFKQAQAHIQAQARGADWTGLDRATENKEDKTTFTLTGPHELIAAFWNHIEHENEWGDVSNQVIYLLHQHAFIMRNDGLAPNIYQIEIKCKGLGCKSRKVIGRGEGRTFEEAAMLALLRAKGFEVKYENGSQ